MLIVCIDAVLASRLTRVEPFFHRHLTSQTQLISHHIVIALNQIYKPDIDGHMDGICDYTFNETVLAYSHENIKSLGHSMMADFLNVWTMLWLTGSAAQARVSVNK